MPRLFNFLRKEKSKDVSQQIYVDVKRTKEGITYSLYRGQKENHVSFPLKLSIYELRQQENISLLEILEELWLDEVLKDTDKNYLLPYSLFAELPSEVKGILGIPEPTVLQLKLGHEGAVGLATFRIFLEKSYGQWQHLEKTSRQIGPWITLPDGTELLMDEGQYHYQELVEQVPNPRDKDRIFSYVAEVRNKAIKMNIPLDDYLNKQEYLFVDDFEIDFSYDTKEIKLEPRYSSNEDIPDSLLHEMSRGGSIFATGPNNKKIFVNPDVQKKSKQISELDTVKGSNIPRFVENPETFLPDIEGLDISIFSERVKSLGIQVYRAQPFVHANERERGWFDIDTGFTVLDAEGEIHASFESEEILDLVHKAKELGDDFIEWNNQWIKVPQNAEVFIETSNTLRDEFRKEVDITKLPYVLEIFENISLLEFNQPILEAQKQMKDLGILDPVPPKSFIANLKPFQEDGFIWLKSLHYRRIGGLLADDMGLGKTIQVVSFLSYLQQTKQLTPVLIVVPKTLIENWEKELMKFAPSLLGSIRIHSGLQRTKNSSVLQQTGITITTYQTLVKDQLVFGQVDWQAVICDEAQAIKNPSTAASKVIKAMKARFRLAMTGTPVENSLSELWSIMDFVQPGLLGSLSQFKKEFVTQMENSDSTEVEDLLTSRIARVYKRRTKTGELGNQLPSKSIVVREVPMGSVQLALYKEVLTLVKEKMLSGLEAIQKLKSLSSHPALINEKYNDLSVRDIPKLTETLNIIEEVSVKGEKVLIFTEYIQMQQLLRKWIRETFEINPMIINGMTNRRQQLVDIFNEKIGFDVMILSPKAAGTGLTITSANHVIHYTRWWNPAVENQATDRVYRIGQEKPVTVYYPIVTDQQGLLREGTVEQIVHRILGEKLELATSVIVPSKKINIEDEVLRGLQVH
ncbi:DEAD/DEAH box helicase [Neobacillus niacini]|uniref:DEAD/DEAH box helicase n=1 Tax=Neobacillus niacini TaxID=86668 RepID=UPI00203B6085|nr:DEAD/DEAH box helicase [Neobacillus niacini]